MQALTGAATAEPCDFAWAALQSGLNGSVQAMVVFDDGSGSGPQLYVGGSFTAAGGVFANRIASGTVGVGDLLILLANWG